MTPDPMVLDATDTVGTAARLFEQIDISGAPVTGARGEVVGMISKTDLIRHALQDRDERPPRFLFEPFDDEFDGLGLADEQPIVLVEEVMNNEPIVGRPDEPIVDIARRMSECRVHRIIIVDESNCPLGIVTALDLLKVLTGPPRPAPPEARASPPKTARRRTDATPDAARGQPNLADGRLRTPARHGETGRTGPGAREKPPTGLEPAT